MTRKEIRQWAEETVNRIFHGKKEEDVHIYGVIDDGPNKDTVKIIPIRIRHPDYPVPEIWCGNDKTMLIPSAFFRSKDVGRRMVSCEIIIKVSDE